MNSDNDKTKDNPNNSGSGEHTEDSKNSDQTDGDRVIEHILEQPADSVSDTTSAKAQEKNDTRKICRDQADEHPDNIQPEDLYQTGVIGRIVKVLQQEDNSIGILVDVVSRVEMTEFIRTKSFCSAKVTVVQETKQKADNLTKAFAREIISSLKELIQLNPLIREELGQFVNQISIDDPSRLADFSATLTTAEREKLQEILETANISKRLEKTLLLIKKEVDLSRLQAKISKQVEERLSKNQREFFLREQLKEIKKELGLSKDEKTQEIEKLIKRASRLKMPKEVKEVFDEEINKINLLDAQSPEFNVSRNYLDWLGQSAVGGLR
ncbi:hypothetical protein CHS0354_006927 [Potamilus streckersoni]|uniref:Lon N-terminal domain-containing protein n=1 Tax=Potamilus streckersoni TaxID=2493646 RepID=A0AAE0TEH3_9BIVA|nr:hypothetical protein CHS0354_006927 [Potamilus streckersoni]